MNGIFIMIIQKIPGQTNDNELQKSKEETIVCKQEVKGAVDNVSAAIINLKNLHVDMKDARKEGKKYDDESINFNRKSFDDVILRKMFIIPSFEIYGGCKGLYDLGPPACALKVAIIDMWRKHFVLAESMCEIDCTCLTPKVALKTSGHIDRFTDLMVKDIDTGECFRADKILEHAIDDFINKNNDITIEEKENHRRIQRQADAFSSTEIDDLLRRYNCKGCSGKPYSLSFPFNLMFKTNIGPEGASLGFLRPETAQGIFVNFRRLLDASANKMPFAAAQIGISFRNEISPRSGLLRVREFCMGEIEHFVNPMDKSHPSFNKVANIKLVMLGRDSQIESGDTIKMSIGEAVKIGLVNNETLAYYMARTQLFMIRIGLDRKRLRFRQHLKTEMAHYACDCWDLEIHNSYGWVECVGHADRACYDLDVHSRATGTPMEAMTRLDKPMQIEAAKLKINRKILGKTFKRDQSVVSDALESLAENWTNFEPVAKSLEKKGKFTLKGYELTKDMLTWSRESKKLHDIKFTPSVIEPSFGIGRILYSLLEHSFYQREEDEQRCVMRFNPIVAPYKCTVLPIVSGEEINRIVDEIAADQLENNITVRVDKSTASLGRRYARADEIGVPFAVTVDFRTLSDGTVTLRERDSTMQIRLPKTQVTNIICEFVHDTITWADSLQKFPLVNDIVLNTTKGTSYTNAKTVIISSIRGTFSRPANNII